MYSDLSTNAHVLNEGDPLTRDQIDALAKLEDEWINQRGWGVSEEKIEGVLHAFMCQAMHDCVCATPKEVY